MKSSTISITILLIVLLVSYSSMRLEALAQEHFMQGEKLFADLVTYTDIPIRSRPRWN